MKWERLREKAVKEFYPEESEIEKLEQKYAEISRFIQEESGLDTFFAGSASRKTCMKGDRDIDIFVLFPENKGRQELEDKGLEIGKKVFEEFNGEHQVEYAEHPYTRGKIDGHEIEIVPCYDTDPEDIESSVDRTPHHSRWVEDNLDSEQKEDVVLLKKFLKAEGIYGSSLKTRGFSGYLCEVLIAEYGSFDSLITEAVGWSGKEIIDPADHNEELPNELEEKFSGDSLIVIDPVDPERNVAAVLSSENYSRFIYRCWKFSNDPGMDFFQREEKEFTKFGVKQEVDNRADFIVLEFENIDEVEDIVYPQMRKTVKRLEDELEKRDFRVFDSGFHIGEKTRIFFDLDRTLPGVAYMQGPKVFHGEDHLEQFTGKYDNVFIDGDRLVAKTSREFTDAKEFLQEFLEGDLKSKGVPDNVAENLHEYSFSEPVVDDEKWLKYLAKKLHVKEDGRS